MSGRHAESPATEHVAILRRPYLDLIMEGRKTLEGRITVRPVPPWRCVEPGDTIHIKRSGGGYAGRAIVGSVEFVTLAGEADVARLRRRVARRLFADDAFWEAKAAARYATLIELDAVTEATTGPSLDHLSPGQRRSAWHLIRPHTPTT